MKLEDKERSGDEQGELLLALIGEVLTKYRKLSKLSQTELAELASINRPYISDIERGMRNVSLLTLDSICFALDRTPADILQEVYVLYKIRGQRRRQTNLDRRKKLS
jgi:transcriptional regulator with XRE-family HTH domain